ncbi:hypothetical protein PHSY_004396 [Pseudozyma hubeiensis SY62]|uniref:Uncharacterized protein n=1 Tax=Pseudozyma hubeiensis (strain SY62) TaxID=1305764 RepID=R9P6F3_PSEHS|nr:hypothetical protein PHSY_004396 [Pseudozyma hubeiensis SY62]GAC96812.1 hypothetical protein PHSY_004396 [Pseudozyma hubeiensis SY62]
MGLAEEVLGGSGSGSRSEPDAERLPGCAVCIVITVSPLRRCVCAMPRVADDDVSVVVMLMVRESNTPTHAQTILGRSAGSGCRNSQYSERPKIENYE